MNDDKVQGEVWRFEYLESVYRRIVASRKLWNTKYNVDRWSEENRQIFCVIIMWIPVKFKYKFYNIVIRPVMMYYSSEAVKLVKKIYVEEKKGREDLKINGWM